jgi:hypothetical protein
MFHVTSPRRATAVAPVTPTPPEYRPDALRFTMRG